ncbi:hypothetical protein HYS96_03535 [Candidatus Daviesbacteria bacterium]|nr:hypothetical protein [Candidatus Daviesbacteria bacterium]
MSGYVESSTYWESARARGVTLNRTPETRVVVTGIEAMTPLGYLSETMQAFRESRSGVISREVGNCHTRLQAPLPELFDPMSELTREERKMMGFLGAMEVVIARRAGKAAGVIGENGRLLDRVAHKNRVGAWIGSGIAEAPYLIEVDKHLHREVNGVVDPVANSRRISPTLAVRVFPEEPNGDVARLLGLSGESGNTVEACATGASNIYHGYKSILSGENDIVFVGGFEETLREHARMVLGIFAGINALSTRNDSPETASRPFDSGRDGFVAASGGALLVLEGLNHALRREAPILAEVLGAAKSIDGHAKTESLPLRIADTIAQALYDPSTGGLWKPDGFFAHATSTQIGDKNEAEAFQLVFGDETGDIPVTAIKSFIGHTLGGAGAVNAAVAIQSLLDGEIPHILNLQNPDPEITNAVKMTFVRNHFMKHPMRTALAVAYGFGGYNCALLLGRYIP